MAVLHYQVSHIDHLWVVSCEDVLIDTFEGRNKAVSAAMKLVNAAKSRGDKPFLSVDHARKVHKSAAS